MHRRMAIGVTALVLAVVSWILWLVGPGAFQGRAPREGEATRDPGRAPASALTAPASHGTRALALSGAAVPDAGAGEVTDAPGTLSLRGRVTDAQGQPLEGVRVDAESHALSSHYAEAETTTDAEGHFRLASLAPGLYGVSFRQKRFLPRSIEGHALTPTSGPLIVALESAPAIEGRVVDTLGQPISGAQVSLFFPVEPDEEEPLEPHPYATERTGPDGRFVLDTPLSRRWFISARHEGFIAVGQEISSPARDVWVVLGEGTSVELSVVDEQDRPVPEARVWLWADTLGEVLVRSQADAAGRTVLQGLRAGSYLLMAMPPRRESFRIVTQALVLREKEQRRVRLRFEEGASISGVVVDQAGRPVSEALVLPFPGEVSAKETPEERLLEQLFRGYRSEIREELFDLERATRTGPDGRFTLRHLLPRTYGCIIGKKGYLLRDASAGTVEEDHGLRWLEVPAGTSSLRVVLSYKGLVSGRVVHASDGEPLTSFRVNGIPFDSSEGTFSVAAGEPGRQSLSILAPGIGGTSREYEAREGEDLDLGDVVLGEGRPVRVRVEDAETGRPVEGAWLSVEDLSRGQRLSEFELGLDGRLMTGRDGTVLLPDVPSRPAALTVNHGDYEETRVELGAEAQQVTIHLRVWATVQGWVRADGMPLAKGDVWLLNPQGEEVKRLDVKEGWFSGRLRPGRYLARITCDACPTPPPVFLPKWVEVPGSGEVLALEFDDVRSGATLEVRFDGRSRLALAPGQHPLPTNYEEFAASIVAEHPRELLEDPDRYLFRKVPAGRYTLVGRSGMESFFREEVELPAEGVVKLTLPHGEP